MRAVVFDMDGVLLLGWRALPERLARWDRTLREELGIDPEALERKFFRGVFKDEVLTGQKSLREALGDVLPKIGYKGEIDVFIRYWFERDTKIDSAVFEIVKKLKASGRARLYIATNNEKARADYFWNEVGFKNWFEDIFYASGLGCAKPDPAFFRACEARMPPLQNQDGPPLYFDDDPSYVKGARACGWEGVLFQEASSCAQHPFIRQLLGLSDTAS